MRRGTHPMKHRLKQPNERITNKTQNNKNHLSLNPKCRSDTLISANEHCWTQAKSEGDEIWWKEDGHGWAAELLEEILCVCGWQMRTTHPQHSTSNARLRTGGALQSYTAARLVPTALRCKLDRVCKCLGSRHTQYRALLDSGDPRRVERPLEGLLRGNGHYNLSLLLLSTVRISVLPTSSIETIYSPSGPRKNGDPSFSLVWLLLRSCRGTNKHNLSGRASRLVNLVYWRLLYDPH